MMNSVDKKPNWTNSLKWIGPIFIVSLIYILDYRYFVSPPLRSDDWEWLVYSYIFAPLKVVDLTNRRPFISTLFSLLTPIFGLRIQWYYVVNWLIIFVMGVVIYQIVVKVFPKHSWLALPIALIFLIYPVNYARTWLVIVMNALALLLALLVILLMIEYSKTGRGWLIIVGHILLVISLGMYEVGFGIVLLTTFFLCCSGKIPKQRRVIIGTLFLTCIAFLVFRTFIQPKVLGIHDFYLDSVSLSVPAIFQRYIQGLFIFLFNWIGPFLFGFGDKKYWAFVGICAVLLVVFLILLPRIIKSAKENPVFLYNERMHQIRSLLEMALLGAGLWVAGYIPMIALWQPIFYGDGSRVNMGAVPGAALFAVAASASLITLLAKKKEVIYRILIIMLIPMLLLGMVFQVHSQEVRFQVWEVYKGFWRALFDVVPGFEEGTKVVIVIPGYDELGPFEMLPFRGDWEAQSALRVLYNDQSLFAEYYYADIPEHADNWFPASGEDFSRFVFIFFDPEASQVRVIEDPRGVFNFPGNFDGYDPYGRVIEYELSMGEYRWLVE